MASVYKRGKNWIASYLGSDGLWHAKSAGTDKGEAMRIASHLENKGMLIREGIVDSKQQKFAANGKAGIVEHIAAYRADLLGRNRTGKHVATAVKRVENLLTMAKIERLPDISGSRISTALGQLRDSGMAERTIAHYTRCIKCFTRWAWRNSLCADDPLAVLAVKVNVPLAERKHIRRPFSAEELRQLLVYTKSAPKRWNMAGIDRRMLYMVACGTGFRANELRSLTLQSFKLNELAISLSGTCAKNGKDVLQPIPMELAEELKPWLKGRKAGPVFTLPYLANIVRMLRDDMNHARIAYYRAMYPGAERRNARRGDFLRPIDVDGRFADFHALRATYITMLARANVPVKVLQTLARHSDPKLTLNTYATMGISDMNAAVALLPNLNALPSAERGREELRATGTDNAGIDAGNSAERRAENALKTGGKNVPFGAVACHQESKYDKVAIAATGAGLPHKSSGLALVAQRIEQRFPKPQVTGSIPVGRNGRFKHVFRTQCGDSRCPTA